jgi:putative DNA primase/helicase
VGEQRDHVFVIHYGEGGNGKGTFIRALERVLGPYATKVHLSLLVEVKHAEHDTVRASLFRTRLAVADETAQQARLNESSVKNLTGGDRIRARRMREDPWSFDPTHSLWLLTNHLPQIRGRDTGIWRRIRVVKWVRTFLGQEADTTLDAVLASEAPGILNWLVEGCQAWQAHGLREPEAVLRDTLAYRESQDVLARFAEDVGLTFDRGLAIGAGRLQELLKAWIEQEGMARPNNKAVGDWLASHGVRVEHPRLKGRQVKFWRGVGIPGEDGLLVEDARA